MIVITVTVNDRLDVVMGDKRVIVANVDIPLNGALLITDLHVIESVMATSATNNPIGATASGGTVSLKIGGAPENGAFVTVIGI